MSKHALNYNILVKEALGNVIRSILSHVSQHGLPPPHHFYIAFRTPHKGVKIPDYLKNAHPEEMVIALQHQFRDLKVEETEFQVTLNFNKIPETLSIPFEAIISFHDPSAHFSLQFDQLTGKNSPHEVAAPGSPQPLQPVFPSTRSSGSNKPQPAKAAEIIPLDTFRKPDRSA